MRNRPDFILTFGRTAVEVWPDYVRTILPDGAEVIATPEDDDAYRATATRLGYGSDTARMCRDHEVAHSVLAHLLGLPESPTLGRVARGQESTEITGLEEDAALALQRLATALGIDLVAMLAIRQAQLFEGFRF